MQVQGSRSEEPWRGCREGYDVMKRDAFLCELLLHDGLWEDTEMTQQGCQSVCGMPLDCLSRKLTSKEPRSKGEFLCPDLSHLWSSLGDIGRIESWLSHAIRLRHPSFQRLLWDARFHALQRDVSFKSRSGRRNQSPSARARAWPGALSKTKWLPGPQWWHQVQETGQLRRSKVPDKIRLCYMSR